MPVVSLRNGALSTEVSTRGGTLLGFRMTMPDGHSVPLLREAPGTSVDALQSACYPLVPFGNRVRDNRFSFAGRDYTLLPNTDWDRHRLHGEGWISEWDVVSQSGSTVDMRFSHLDGDGTPYRYEAHQSIALDPDRLSLKLSVTNRGGEPLPFGLGWHPYFPMTPRTTLKARCSLYWTEEAEWLPGQRAAIPAELDFTRARTLPRHWVNNGFEGWDNHAEIVWPERSMTLRMEADPLFRHAFLFVGDRRFDPTYDFDYFCFEPMSHLADGHNRPGLGDLVVLEPGESLSGSVRFMPRDLEPTANG